MEVFKVKKRYIAIFSILVVFGFLFALSLVLVESPIESASSEGITFNPAYHVTLERPNEGIIYEAVVHNVITNDGLDLVRDKIGLGSSPTSVDYMALSIDSADPVTTDANLSEEITGSGLARAAGAVTIGDVGNGNWTVSYKWTATAEQNNIWKFAVFNDSLLWDGETLTQNTTMFSEGNFTANVSMQANDELTVNVTYTVS